MMAVRDAIDDGGELAAHVAVQAGAEDLGDLVAGQTEPASLETAEFSEAGEKVLGQLRSRFSKGEP
jgi:hypothetical protein